MEVDIIAPGFEKTAMVFDQILDEQPHGTAAQLAVLHRGKSVVDLAGSRSASHIVHSQTPFLTFSVSKAFTSAAIWRLIGEGVLELDAPVERYWSEYAQRGKEGTTLRQVLLHQAGIPAPHLERQVFTWPFWRMVINGLEHEKALYPPGTQTSYHLVNFGFILGEIVRRVTGEPIDRYLAHTFFEPMGLCHTWMRIPAAVQNQSPRLLSNSPAMRSVVSLFNVPVIRCSLIPAAGLHSTACELASFFQMLLDGGQYQGKQYLQPEIITLAARSHFDGYDSYVKVNMNWGLGLIIGGGMHIDPDPNQRVMGSGSSSDTFAALGMGTCMVWADRKSEIVTAYTTNAMHSDRDTGKRWAKISNVIWECLEMSC